MLSFEQNCAAKRRPYICAKSKKTVTLGGPPSSLRLLLQVQGCFYPSASGLRSRVPIYAPYHAHQLYTLEDVRRILSEPSILGAAYDLREPSSLAQSFISGYDGKHYEARSGSDMLELSLYNILAQPILWEEVIGGCAECINVAFAAKYTVWNIGPSLAAEGLARSLNSRCTSFVSYGGTFLPARWLQDQSPDPRDVVAIIGMSGRFPKATTIRQFWENLEQGLDCHQVVRVL